MYPIDQSDGGEDDDPLEHQQWVETLKQQGRNPATPWLRQHPAIAIDSQRDYITDRGDEVWAILEARGIQHVILTGVHTNMCVLGRPFGLRQMVRQGRDVVLMRDLTDTMYNPQRWPYVDHFTGTDRIIEHIERFVCGTVTSAQVLGGKPFRYSTDDRIRLAVLLGEGLYDTASTLPEFAAANLGRDFQVMWIVADDKAAGEWVGFESLQDADAALISVRRRSLTEKQLQILRDFVAQGKPMIGLRTASHAFDVRGEVPVGRAVWPEFDAEVWGGNYHNHYSDDLASTVTRLDAAESHPILAGVPDRPLLQGGSLYRTSPLNPAAVPLLEGTVSGEGPEPVAWTFIRADGGRSFYASLGHPDDFAQAAWVDLLTRAIYHTVGRDVPADYRPIVRGEDLRPWPTVKIPASAEETLSDSAWYRAVIQISREEPSEEPWEVELPEASDVAIWIDGHRLQPATASGMTRWTIPPEILKVNQPQFWAIRVLEPKPPGFPLQAARVVRGPETWVLAGTWQTRRVSAESAHDTAGFENLPLPAQFGGGSDIVLRLDPLTD